MNGPVLPPQSNGWQALGAWQSSPNGRWTVTAKRGAQVLRIEGLSPEAVETFDASARWAKQ